MICVFGRLEYCLFIARSQTSWKVGWNKEISQEYLEMKITELGILTHPGYRIAFGRIQ